MNPLEIHQHVAQSSGRELGDVSPLAAELLVISSQAKDVPNVPPSVAKAEDALAHAEPEWRDREIADLYAYIETIRNDAESIDLSTRSSQIHLDKALLALVELYEGEEYVAQALAAIENIPRIWADSEAWMANASLELYQLTGNDVCLSMAEDASGAIRESGAKIRYWLHYAEVTNDQERLRYAQGILDSKLMNASPSWVNSNIPPVALGLAKAGYADEAYDYTTMMLVGAERVEVLVELAAISASTLYVEKAQELVGQMQKNANGDTRVYETLRMNIAVAAGLRDPAFTAEVLKSVEEYGDLEDNPYLLTDIAIVVARQGDIDGALKILADIPDSTIYQYGLAPIISVMAERGDIVRAIRYAEGLEDEVSRLKTYVEIYRNVRSRIQELES